MRISGALLTAITLLFGQQALAIGLDQLSDQNPADEATGDDASATKAKADGDKTNADDAGAEATGDQAEGQGAEATETNANGEFKLKSTASKAVAGKLALATSYGWVHASRKTGSWSSNGLSDLLVSYKIVPIGKNGGLAVTYRYVPIDVSGTNGARSYRGVWEGHYLGARYNDWISQKVDLVGSLEAGLVRSHMVSVDGLPVESAVEQGGGSVALGAGADFALLKSRGFTVGPRVYAGAGTFTTFQYSVAAGFMF